MYLSCPGATEAHSQGGGVTVPLSRYSWLLCIVSTQFTSEYNYSTFDKTKPMTQQGDTSLDPKMHHLYG